MFGCVRVGWCSFNQQVASIKRCICKVKIRKCPGKQPFCSLSLSQICHSSELKKISGREKPGSARSVQSTYEAILQRFIL